MKKRKNKNSGFVLLFAVTISAMLLAIALGVANIALKEFSFSTSAKSSNEALYAADAGVECVLTHDQFNDRLFIQGTPSGNSVNCRGINYTLTGSWPSWNVIIPNIGQSGQACVKVAITKDDQTNPPFVETIITATGYNLGDAACNWTNQNRVERELVVTYDTAPENFAFGKPVTLVNTGSGDCSDGIMNGWETGVDSGGRCDIEERLTDGIYTAGTGQGELTLSYEVDLGSLRNIGQINVVVCRSDVSPGDVGCFGFNYEGPDGVLGTADDTPYITSWQIEGRNSGGSYQTIATGGQPNARTISVFPSFDVSEIKFSAQSTTNAIAVIELEAY